MLQTFAKVDIAVHICDTGVFCPCRMWGIQNWEPGHEWVDGGHESFAEWWSVEGDLHAVQIDPGHLVVEPQ
jgi:hypothetical protein